MTNYFVFGFEYFRFKNEKYPVRDTCYCWKSRMIAPDGGTSNQFK